MSSVVADDSRKYWEPVYRLDNTAVKLDTETVMDIELEMPVYKNGLVSPAHKNAPAMIGRIEGLRLV